MINSNSKSENLIISLTSYPERIAVVHEVIETLLNQTYTADKIILWLAHEQFPNKMENLPESLVSLIGKIFSIMWCEDLKSYKKLIPALKAFPESVIITVDDDTYYAKDMVEGLVKAYNEIPDMVHAYRVHRILFRKENMLPYMCWDFCIKNVVPSYNNFFTGMGGVLYPPGILHNDVLKSNLFMDLSPTGDDIWFWAMLVLNDKKINVVNGDGIYKQIDGTQDKCLFNENARHGNDIQLSNVLKQYPDIINKLNRKLTKKQSEPTFLEKIYSIREEAEHKIIRILGLKISLRK